MGSGSEIHVSITTEEVAAHVEKVMARYLRRVGAGLPPEQKDELRQRAHLRVLEALTRITDWSGLRSFVKAQCRGAVLDYFRSGEGFEETKWKAASTDGRGISSRVDVDPGSIRDNSEPERIHWDLVSRMASVDLNLHIFAKLLMGFTQQEIADQLSVSRARVSHRVSKFLKRLDSPEFYYSKWVRQTIFALGLSERFHMDGDDNGIGWNLPAIDVADPRSFTQMRAKLSAVSLDDGGYENPGDCVT